LSHFPAFSRCAAIGSAARRVWAFSELLVERMKGEGMFELARQQAEAAEQRRKPQPTQPVPQPGSME
jgi:hypothetical protein